MEDESSKKKEADDSTHRRRKAGLKFAPKVLPKKAPKIIPKTEPRKENKGVTIDKKILIGLRSRQSTDAFGNRAKTEEQETRIQVAFGRADPSILRTFPTPRSSLSGVSAVKLPNEHDEPWVNTLDEEEFRQSSSSGARDGELTAAEELGLMERMDKPQLLFFQFPTTLPLTRQADPAAETDIDTNVDVNAKSKGNNRKRGHHLIHGRSMKELPGGLMGKILVYKSGKVKMMLGDARFDVSAGSNCSFAQEVVAIDSREKHCCSLGEVGNRAVVTPDIDSLLDYIAKME